MQNVGPIILAGVNAIANHLAKSGRLSSPITKAVEKAQDSTPSDPGTYKPATH